MLIDLGLIGRSRHPSNHNFTLIKFLDPFQHFLVAACFRRPFRFRSFASSWKLGSLGGVVFVQPTSLDRLQYRVALSVLEH